MSESPEPKLPKLVVEVAKHFRDTGTWPRYRDLELEYRRSGPLEVLLQKLVPEFLQVHRGSDSEHLVLSAIKHYAALPESEEDIDAFVRASALFAKAYIADLDDATISADQLQDKLELGNAGLRRVCEMIEQWGSKLNRGGTRGDDHSVWQFDISSRAMYFESVESLEDFQRCVETVDELERIKRGRASGPLFGGTRAAELSFPPLRLRNIPAAEWDLHPAVAKAAASLFSAGHYAEAARAAVERFENFVQDALDDFTTTGERLFGQALGGTSPAIPLNRLQTGADQDEQRGFLLMARGAYATIRNVHSHGKQADLDARDALERLVVVSLLFRRVEQARSRSQTTEHGA